MQSLFLGTMRALCAVMNALHSNEKLSEFWRREVSDRKFCAVPAAFRGAIEDALIDDNWSAVGHQFRNGDFIGEAGVFALVGHYRVLRKGIWETHPLGIYGRVLPSTDFTYLEDVAREWLGPLADIPSPILPVEIYSTTSLSRESAEAFIVPDGWVFEGSANGPALNNMTEQKRRFEKGAKGALRKIFESATADLLIDAVESSRPFWEVQHREFSYHEFGHATGLGLKRKLSDGVLATPWYRGVEEWRADGIAFELMARTLSPHEAGRTIAANFALRFGVDAQRGDGMERDTDVNSALLTFESLFQSGSLKIGPNRKIEFNNPSYEGLLHSTEKMRHETLCLTREETALSYTQGIWGLYGSVQVSAGSRRFFQNLVVDPCQGIFSELC